MSPQDLLTANGKPLPVSQKKTLGRLVEMGLLALDYSDQRETITHRNPFSGVEVKLSALASAIADVILTVNITSQIGLRDWDNLRMTFRLCWPEVYYKLVD
jgi:hypothetical protein